MKTTIIALILTLSAVVAVLSYTVLTQSSRLADTSMATCLYASVKIYPSWNPANGPVLENIRECKALSADQRTTLRGQVAAFTEAGEKDR